MTNSSSKLNTGGAAGKVVSQGANNLFTELEFFTTDRDSQGRIFIDEHMLRVRQMLKESQLGRR